MSTTETSPQALLKRAAAIITERGWYQGSWSNEEGCVCTWGALNVALAEASGLDLDEEAPKPPDPDYTPGDLYDVYADAELALSTAINDALDGQYRGIAEWNDLAGRTKDEVEAMLRRAAGAVAK